MKKRKTQSKSFLEIYFFIGLLLFIILNAGVVNAEGSTGTGSENMTTYIVNSSESIQSAINNATNETTNSEEKEKKSLVEQSTSFITGAVIGLRNINQKNIRIAGSIFVLLIIILVFNFYGGIPGIYHIKRAIVFHKRAQKAHLKGNYEKANKLYNKSYLLREKGEAKRFKRS